MADMNGLCDVKGCQNLPLLGWRSLTERIGREICEQHWRRHKDKQDSFDLYDTFGFRRPPQAPKPEPMAKPVCNCGREITPRHRFCDACAAERKRQRNKQYYHGKKVHQAEPIKESTLKCKQCGGPRSPRHSYCQKCSQSRGSIRFIFLVFLLLYCCFCTLDFSPKKPIFCHRFQ